MKFLFVIFFFIANIYGEAKIGSEKNPIRFFLSPSYEANTISTNTEHFFKFLEKETGYYFKYSTPLNYVAVVEAFGANGADVAVMNSFGYLLASSKYGATAKLKTIREGKENYFAAIYVNAKSNIKKLSDLNGKNFAFTDSASSSGYIYPLKLLKDANVKIGNSVFLNKHDSVITAIYQGRVEAGGAFYMEPQNGKILDIRMKVKNIFQDVEKKVLVLKVSEPIPNEPVAFRKDFPAEMADKITAAMLKYLSGPDGPSNFKKVFIVDGLVPANDHDYDGMRSVIKAMDLDVSKLFK